jgi:adenosylcobinamide-phosphate synthase
VIGKLKKAQLPEARAALAMIVGRDTRALDESEIMRAVIETVAENTSDGFVAPMFYLAIGGVPAAVSAPA